MSDDAEQSNSSASPREKRLAERSVLQLTMAMWLIVIFLTESIASGITLPTVAQRFQSLSFLFSSPQASTIGHLYFFNSDQTSLNSNQGIADEVVIEIQSPHPPPAGKSYYAWLLPDAAHPDNAIFLLGKVVISAGTGSVSYNDPQHTNLLAVTSQLLITEQDTAVSPVAPSTDKSDWRYVGEIPQQPNPNAPIHYSLLDHLRHLLASDPTLEEFGYHGGIGIWLYRNTQQIYQWAIDAVSDWQSKKGTNVSLIRQDMIRILDYLDGIDYVQRDVPTLTPYQVRIAAPSSTFGLLQFDPQQPLPGYLQHMSVHLNGVITSPGTNNLMQTQAAQILASANNVNKWFEQIRRDAIQLLAMTDEQLQNQQASTLLNDVAKNADFALNGVLDPVTGKSQGGIERMYIAIQGLATMDITQFKV